MIQIRTWGGDADQRKATNSIARWSAHKLMTDRMASSLKVNIALIKDLFLNQGMYGDIEPLDVDARRPKQFKIRIDASMAMRNMLTTVAHEMVHVKQYALEEMKGVSQRTSFIPMTKFKGELYYDHMNYWEQPWELEAHGWERGLFEMWAEANDVFKHPKENAWAFEDFYPPGYWKDK
jgi:hypothetical protein